MESENFQVLDFVSSQFHVRSTRPCWKKKDLAVSLQMTGQQDLVR